MTVDQQQLFQDIGGEAGVRRLVDRFYDLMDTLPEARGLRALHPPTLDESRNKLHWFLVGWMGGPPLYVERFGNPRLRARHLPFSIGTAEADVWMRCMDQALGECVADPEVRATLQPDLARLAAHLRNRPEP